jgi:hypothetical protein
MTDDYRRPTAWEQLPARDRAMVIAAIRHIESHYEKLAGHLPDGLADLEEKKRAYALAAKRLEEMPS